MRSKKALQLRICALWDQRALSAAKLCAVSDNTCSAAGDLRSGCSSLAAIFAIPQIFNEPKTDLPAHFGFDLFRNL